MPSRPLFAMDDAVIQTTGGLIAPLAQQGSRRLAPSGLERRRSMRRVASEADLSDISGIPDDQPGVSNILDIPLTAEAARALPSSRDFTFAGGISPPSLTPPPPTYTSPNPESQPGTEQLSTRQTFASAMQDGSSPSETLPLYRSPTFSEINRLGATPAPVYQTIEGVTRTHISPIGGNEVLVSNAAMQTAVRSVPAPVLQQETSHLRQQEASPERINRDFISPGPMLQGVPQLAVTAATPGYHGERDNTGPVAYARSSVYTLARETLDPSHESMYSTMTGQLGSPFMTAAERDASRRSSISSYVSAPPPVPSRDSRYETASVGPSSRAASPARYQLHDDAVPANSEVTEFVTDVSTSGIGPPPPGSEHWDETTHVFVPPQSSWESSGSAIFRTAMSSRSPPMSEYATALPPPISRPTSPGGLSFSSDYQDRAETATHISEPDTDADLIADLERRSTAGSEAPRPLQRRPATSSKYLTVDSHFSSGPSDYTSTLYDTARDSAYVTAQSWRTQSAYLTAEAGSLE